jgi:hypothetical protein
LYPRLKKEYVMVFGIRFSRRHVEPVTSPESPEVREQIERVIDAYVELTAELRALSADPSAPSGAAVEVDRKMREHVLRICAVTGADPDLLAYDLDHAAFMRLPLV